MNGARGIRGVRSLGVVLAALSLGCALDLLSPPSAWAHPLDFGVLLVRELPGGQVDVSYRFSGSEAAPTGAEPVLPERCRALGPVARTELEVGGESRHLRADCGGPLDGMELGVRGLEGSGVTILVTVVRLDGSEVRALLDDGRRTLVIGAAPRAADVVPAYLALGIEHIALGIDHLLFVLGLVLLSRSARALLLAITAFTLGHSVTLALAALSLANVPVMPVEIAIAASILLLAVELARPPGAPSTITSRRPSVVAAGFGLLHGLGFASALREAGLPSDQVVPALVSFNVGVELGQIAFVGAVTLVLAAASHLGARAPHGRTLAVHLLGGVACYFLLDRLSTELGAVLG